jgi:CarD family transcriptional regulator
MEFKVGDLVAVPDCGVGMISEISEVDLGAGPTTAYHIKILEEAITYMTPLDGLLENGIRPIMPADLVGDIYSVLADREKPADKQTWNRRYREYLQKIKTGQPLELAAVLRDLAILRAEKSLSFGERRMYDRTHGLLVQEIAVARDCDESIIKGEIEAIFEKADAELLKNRKPRPERPFPDDDEEEEDEGRGGGREDDEDDDF